MTRQRASSDELRGAGKSKCLQIRDIKSLLRKTLTAKNNFHHRGSRGALRNTEADRYFLNISL